MSTGRAWLAASGATVFGDSGNQPFRTVKSCSGFDLLEPEILHLLMVNWARVGRKRWMLRVIGMPPA